MLSTNNFGELSLISILILSSHIVDRLLVGLRSRKLARYKKNPFCCTQGGGWGLAAGIVRRKYDGSPHLFQCLGCVIEVNGVLFCFPIFQSSMMSVPPGGVSSRRPSTIRVIFSSPAMFDRLVSCPIRNNALLVGLSTAPGIDWCVTACSRARF